MMRAAHHTVDQLSVLVAAADKHWGSSSSVPPSPHVGASRSLPRRKSSSVVAMEAVPASGLEDKLCACLESLLQLVTQVVVPSASSTDDEDDSLTSRLPALRPHLDTSSVLGSLLRARLPAGKRWKGNREVQHLLRNLKVPSTPFPAAGGVCVGWSDCVMVACPPPPPPQVHEAVFEVMRTVQPSVGRTSRAVAGTAVLQHCHAVLQALCYMNHKNQAIVFEELDLLCAHLPLAVGAHDTIAETLRENRKLCSMLDDATVVKVLQAVDVLGPQPLLLKPLRVCLTAGSFRCTGARAVVEIPQAFLTVRVCRRRPHD